MGIAPIPPKGIKNQQTWLGQIFDTSGIQYDPSKLTTMPASMFECEGYRERLDEHGWEVERVYRVNWSDLAAAMQWCYGYSFVTDQRTLNAGAFGPNGQVPAAFPGAQLQSGLTTHSLSRVPPAQDPYRPWLYADKVELIESAGVPLQDPGLVLRDINGNKLDDTGRVLTTGGPVLAPGAGEPSGGDAGPGEEDVCAPSELATIFLNVEATPAEIAAASATISWGDGTDSEGVVSYAAGNFVVNATHYYLNPGTYTAFVTLEYPGGALTSQETLTAAYPPAAPPAPTSPAGILQRSSQLLPGIVFAEQAGPGVFSDGVATIRVTYRQRPYVVRNDTQNDAYKQGELGRYVERQVDYAIQGVPLANVAKADKAKPLAFAAGPYKGDPIPEAGVMLIPTSSWRYVWHEVPFYPSLAIAACQGGINAAVFDGIAGFPAFPVQTLLCQAPKITWRRTACGQIAFRVEWLLDFRTQGWNSFPAGDGNFYPATWGGTPPAADGSNLVFKPVDFSQLFTVGKTFAFI